MKLVKIFIIIVTCVLSFFSALAQSEHPPQPFAGENAVLAPPPPGEALPIDGNIFILMIIAILFGIYIIYQHKVKEKTTT